MRPTADYWLENETYHAYSGIDARDLDPVTAASHLRQEADALSKDGASEYAVTKARTAADLFDNGRIDSTPTTHDAVLRALREA